jgi:SAM-dependent methyltransferase
MQNWPGATVFGADIDKENVDWSTSNLTSGMFVHVPLMPPTSLRANSLDAVFGISVMTHLTEEVQLAWLKELRRVLKPGGVALLTFGDASAAAWGSFWHTPEWWEGWKCRGFDDGINDPALAGKIGSETYYRHTVQSIEWTRRMWAGVLDVVSIEADLIGNQSLAVLRKP